ATATSYGQLLFWRFLQGVFTPGIFAVVIAYINEEWEAGAGAATAAYVTGTVLGGFSGRLVSALVASHMSWRWAFVTLGTLNLLGAVAIRAWLPAGRHFTRTRRGPASGAMLRHLSNPRLVATYVVAFCVLFSMLGTFTYINFYLAAPPFSLHGGARTAVRRVPGGRGGHAHGGARHRPLRPPLRAGGGLHWQCGGRVPDAGAQPARGGGRAEAAVHGGVHRQCGRIELRGLRGDGISRLGHWALRDVLLPGRQRRERDPRILLGARRVAGLCRADCRGAV